MANVMLVFSRRRWLFDATLGFIDKSSVTMNVLLRAAEQEVLISVAVSTDSV